MSQLVIIKFYMQINNFLETQANLNAALTMLRTLERILQLEQEKKQLIQKLQSDLAN